MSKSATQDSGWVNPDIREILSRGPMSPVERAVSIEFHHSTRSTGRLLAALESWFRDQRELDASVWTELRQFMVELLLVDHNEPYVNTVLDKAAVFSRLCPELADLMAFGNPPADMHQQRQQPQPQVQCAHRYDSPHREEDFQENFQENFQEPVEREELLVEEPGFDEMGISEEEIMTARMGWSRCDYPVTRFKRAITVESRPYPVRPD